MSSTTRLGRSAVVGIALVAMTGPLAVAAPATNEPPAGAKGRYSNFHLLHAGFDDHDDRYDLGYVRDANDVTHAIVDTDDGLQYASRGAGADTWLRTHVPGSRKSDGGELATSPSGRRVYLAAATVCGVFVVDARASSTALPRLRSHPSLVPDCEQHLLRYEVRGIVGLPHRRVAVLVNNTSSTIHSPAGVYVYKGRPGGPWSHTRLSDEPAEQYQPLFLARDVGNGDMYVAGPAVQVFAKYPGQPWSESPEYGTPVGDDDELTSLAAAHGQVWLAYHHCTRDPHRDGKANKVTSLDGVFLVHRDRLGRWSDAVRPFGTDEYSLWLRLIADPTRRGVVHAVYANADYNNRSTTAGMYVVRRTAHDGWSEPAQLTHWWLDKPLHLAITTTGQLRFEFQRN